ncbi:cell division protein FtsB [Nitrosovibrio sp. Nv6]|uniref:cell division protein FtsB n=1 Tax=Nitrosovibrio sp. Nv6 TaxID=1855340 RepID=UPI0008D7974F|nr:cell division protein FtsB [Nitrosovibrio sp. Nv6]SEO41399.1 cell division protein FtsB [Nitrosovibrio sp. Nv6]
MKVLSFILTALIVLLQYPLWLGKGSWLKVWEVDQQVMTQYEINQKLKSRNAALDAEVRDLKQGYEAIEERARSELGMIREDEVFFHITEDNEKNLSQADRMGDGKP